MSVLGRNTITVTWWGIDRPRFMPSHLKSITVPFLTERAPQEVWIEWYGDPAVEASRLLNETIFDQLTNGPPADQADIDRVNNFTRQRMREDGFYRRVMPPLVIDNEELALPVPSDGSPIMVRDPEDRAFQELDEAIADADWGTDVQ